MTAPAASTTPAAPLPILFVDDGSVVLSALKMSLARAGYPVVATTSPTPR